MRCDPLAPRVGALDRILADLLADSLELFERRRQWPGRQEFPQAKPVTDRRRGTLAGERRHRVGGVAEQHDTAILGDPSAHLGALIHAPFEDTIGVGQDLTGPGQASVAGDVQIRHHLRDFSFRVPFRRAGVAPGRDLEAVQPAVRAATGHRHHAKSQAALGKEMFGIDKLGHIRPFGDAEVDDVAGELVRGLFRKALPGDGGIDAIGADHEVEGLRRSVGEGKLDLVRFPDTNDFLAQMDDAGRHAVSEDFLQTLAADTDHVRCVSVQVPSVRVAVEPFHSDGDLIGALANAHLRQRALGDFLDADRAAPGRQRLASLEHTNVAAAVAEQRRRQRKPADSGADDGDG